MVKFHRIIGRDLLYDLRMIDILSDRVELAKRELTVNSSTSVLFSSSDAATLSLRVTQDEFNSINEDLFQRVLSPIEAVLKKAKVLRVNVDEVCSKGIVYPGMRLR